MAAELAALVAVYGVALVASLTVIDHFHGPARYAVSVAPNAPFAALGWIVIRSLRRVDERERALTYRAISFAFFATAVASFGYGFLENAGAPHISMFAVWPTMAGFWLVGRLVAPRMP